jgi:dUTP pyrophosphatase
LEKLRGFEIAKGWEDKNINLPKRSTKYSAGYDFECAEDTIIEPLFLNVAKALYSYLFLHRHDIELFKPTLVPTGIKSYFQQNEVLKLCNRSSNPLKKFLILGNGIGVVDSDYFSNPNNDGHIMGQFYNFSLMPMTIKKGEKIMQGIFQTYLITDNDNADGERNGGFGSTGK